MLRFSSRPFFRHGATRYAMAITAAFAALYLRGLLTPLLGLTNPYHTVWLGVVFCAWFCGVGPSILATLIMVAGVLYWFVPPVHSFPVSDPREYFSVAGFLLFAAIIICIGERARRTQAKLNVARDDMESTVRQRTAELAAANEKLHELSTSLLHLQDTAARRIARDLHDSIGQLLAVISMNLAGLEHEPLTPQAAALLDETRKHAAQVLQQVRTISHLLHPPLLDESGLRPAVTNFVERFAERSKLAVHLQIPPDLPRFSQDLEIAIFRVLQECLTNTHRHAAAQNVYVTIRLSDSTVMLQVRDDGKGSHAARASAPSRDGFGVGLRGMEERVRELHGTFHIDSGPTGTTVTATFPAAEPRPATTAASV